MTLTRRQFLKWVGAGAAVAVGASYLPPVEAYAPAPLPGATGETLTVEASTEPVDETLRVGDVIQIRFPAHYAINPVTRKPTEHLQSFVITAIAGANLTVHPHAVFDRKRVTPIGWKPPLAKRHRTWNS